MDQLLSPVQERVKYSVQLMQPRLSVHTKIVLHLDFADRAASGQLTGPELERYRQVERSRFKKSLARPKRLLVIIRHL